ncbi:MAG: ATP-binding protein [Vulcanibacillus sp.]
MGQENVGRLAQKVTSFNINDSGQHIHTYFEENPEEDGVIILNDDYPMGIIMRQDFYQKLGNQFGYSLYINRPLLIIMKKEFMSVDALMNIAEVSINSMNRKYENLYDFIVVMDKNKYIGIVKIKYFLIDLAKKREEEIALLKTVNEREVQHRIEIEKINFSIKNLMDNARQGFLSINGNFSISPEYSQECINIFGSDIGGRNLLELLFPYLEIKDYELMVKIINKILNEHKTINEQIYLSLLPKELVINGKNIFFEYKIIIKESEKSIMLILTDITDKKELERKMLEEKLNLKMIVKAISSREDLIGLIEDTRAFFEYNAIDITKTGMDKPQVIAELFRIIHTFKGDAGQLNMTHAATIIHEIENVIAFFSSNSEKISIDQVENYIQSINHEDIFKKDINTIIDTLGENYFKKSDQVFVTKEQILTLENRLREILPKKEQIFILSELRKMHCHNFKDILYEFNETVVNVAERENKLVKPLDIFGDDVYIDKQHYKSFIRSLSHIFRNAVDHGLEKPDERIHAGKNEYGKIICSIKKINDKHCIISISDDGKGISIEKLKALAISKSIYSESSIEKMSDKQILDLVFYDEFSTKEETSIFSGRGVGLSAIKNETLNLQGDIQVISKIGLGTTFIIKIPIIF